MTALNMTTLKKIAAVVALAGTTLATVGSAAQADPYGHGYGRGYGAPRGGPNVYSHPAPQPYYGGYGHQRRNRTGEKIATGVAIGVGAIILGSILANQNRRHYPDY